MPFAVCEGIKMFVSGLIPTDNLRFRDTQLVFQGAGNAVQHQQGRRCVQR